MLFFRMLTISEKLKKNKNSMSNKNLKKKIETNSSLTDRELQIVTLVALGWSNKQLLLILKLANGRYLHIYDASLLN
jgi:DNA-binding NarL/FixJ family response regulator